jgi:hypothetical protein
VQAALEEPDFFLVLVAGLEDGEGTLKVRFIFNPLQVLAAKIQGGMTLTGTDKVEALEFAFGRAGAASPPSTGAAMSVLGERADLDPTVLDSAPGTDSSCP